MDLKSSTRACLGFFYPRLVTGGVILTHDYSYLAGVREAFAKSLADKDEFTIELATSTTTRRSLFGAPAAMLLLAAPAAGPAKAAELDGKLLALCADYETAQAAIDKHSKNCPPGGSLAHDDAMDALTIQQCSVMDRIIECGLLRTPEGLQALAKVAIREVYFSVKPFRNTPLEESASIAQLLALVVLRSVAGEA